MNRHDSTEPILPQTTEERVDQVEKKVKTGVRERRAYIILVLISAFLSIAVYIAGSIQQSENEHKFCDIMKFSLAGPAPQKPANPKLHQSRERAYEGYLKLERLSHALGCS